MILEPAAAERAASRLEDAQIAALIEVAEMLAGKPLVNDSAARAIEFDIRFHDVVASACGNERLRLEVIKFRHLVRAFCRLSATPENLRAALDEHRRIIEALRARNPAAAAEAMAAHIASRLRAVLGESGGVHRGPSTEAGPATSSKRRGGPSGGRPRSDIGEDSEG